MKKITIISHFLLIAVLFQSCTLEEEPPQKYIPITLDRATFENSLESQPARTVINSGKIYVSGGLMFINEVNQGFHVYQYSDPVNPVKIGFIQIYGATDLAVRNGNIYINQAVDLVTLEYNETNNSIIVKHRNRNVFPQKSVPNGGSGQINTDEIIINWIPITN